MDRHTQRDGENEELVYGGGVREGGGSVAGGTGAGEESHGSDMMASGPGSAADGGSMEELADDPGNLTGGRIGDEIGYAGSDRVVGGNIERSEAEGDAGMIDPSAGGTGGQGGTMSVSREGSATMDPSSPMETGNPKGDDGVPHDALAEDLQGDRGR